MNVSNGFEFPEGMRVVITGNDADGKSMVVSDGKNISPGPPLLSTTGKNLLGLGDQKVYETDMGSLPFNLEPAPGGVDFHFVAFPPASKDEPLGWHRTKTVDMAIVLSGPVILVLDKCELELQAGDCVIQRNTMHAWKNASNRPVYLAACLTPASVAIPHDPRSDTERLAAAEEKLKRLEATDIEFQAQVKQLELKLLSAELKMLHGTAPGNK